MGTVNRKPGKTWKITCGDVSFLADDFTFEEIESVERATGVPWWTQNPLTSAGVAQAWLALLLVRQGRSDDEARDEVKAMTVRQFKGCFDLVNDDRPTVYVDGAPVSHPNPAPENSTST